MVKVTTKRAIGYSPLRYPGGKSSLTGFFAALIESNFDRPATYVEPYAGGAGAAVALLLQGKVGQVVINDLDPAIFSCWHSMVNRSDEFIARVRETEVSLAEWDRQREVYRSPADADQFELGFATFFLNRTSRSGVLNAGAIGGKSQDGNYRIDARYNKPSLIHMIRRIGSNRDSISVTNRDGLDVIRDHAERDDVFIYADPPYYEKGALLYLNSFGPDHHVDLAGLLNSRPDAKWVLTYDNADAIRDMYLQRRRQVFSLYYSAHSPGNAQELMVFSDGINLPS